MKISYNWLKNYVAHELSPQELADTLTMAGLEVEDVENIGTPLDGVVVGHVLEAGPHPNADRLRLCQVDLGTEEPVQIVCGAPNVAAGQKVPVATVGTTLLLPSRKNPEVLEPITIRKAKLRGEVSRGMICAEDELGLSDDHAGIMVLQEDAPTGQPFIDYLKAHDIEAQDAVLDISITPNRPDATSHIGVARDVAALADTRLLVPDVALPSPDGEAATQFSVEIASPEACPRYVGLLVRNVTVKESPAWLKRRLAAIGLRPLNNIVDITNYVMHECGQPLHAFDFNRLQGGKIIVRLTDQEEPFTALDGKERTLPQGTLTIRDAERAVAIAGVMGGENSEVIETTTDVLIESAYFDPSIIRKTAKALNLQTDASYRFERGIDADGQVWAAARAAALITELAGGELVPGMVDVHPRPAERREVMLRPSRVTRLLGVRIPTEDMIRMLSAIGFEVREEDPLDVIAEHLLEGKGPEVSEEEVALRCVVPTFRPDVEREIDVIEEVVRLYGYDRIPEPAHSVVPNKTPQATPTLTLRKRARALLSGLGYREIYTNSMLPHRTADFFGSAMLPGGQEQIVETLNPISQEMATLRPSLLPGLLQVMSYNQKHGQHLLRFMEFGHVFRRSDSKETLIPGYAEHESFILALSGPYQATGWDSSERLSDFFDLKGVVANMLAALRIPDIKMTPHYTSTPVSTYHLAIASGNQALGQIARVSDELAERLDLRDPVFFAEFDWEAVVSLAAPELQRRYVPISRFPIVERDLALVVAREQAAGPLMETMRQAGGPLLQRVDMFDLYEGERIEAEKKSLAFTLRFGANRTLQDKEVDSAISAIVKALEETHQAELRG